MGLYQWYIMMQFITEFIDIAKYLSSKSGAQSVGAQMFVAQSVERRVLGCKVWGAKYGGAKYRAQSVKRKVGGGGGGHKVWDGKC